MEFKEFRKIARLTRGMVVTEKIDGTNAQVVILKKQEIAESYDSKQGEPIACSMFADNFIEEWYLAEKDGLYMFAGSRNRWIRPGKESDNYGFASWVKANSEELFQLGEGHHYGEWWGKGIQRGYGLDVKKFSLFDAHRWSVDPSMKPDCVDLVPILAVEDFNTKRIDSIIEELRLGGSVAAPGFMEPEGIIIFHVASRTMYKKTVKDDDKPKTQKENV